MKKYFFLLILLPCKLWSQTIVNDYNQVTALAGNLATLTSLTGTQGIHTLAVGDTVLIIQMQGATIDTTNSASFGNTTVNNAGNYEINVICAASGNQVAFKYALVNSYTAATGKVQIVSHGNGQLASFTIPAGGITAQAWNGATGGIVFIKAASIIVSGSINAAGLGFRGGPAGGIPGNPNNVCNKNIVTNPGGTYCWTNGGCNGASSTTGAAAYYYPKYSLDIPVTPAFLQYSPPDPATPPANLLLQYTGGWKGEGIANYVINKETGRGKQANGGGGGQTHNSGGAGGSLYGVGGSGGNQWNGASPAGFANGGVGGVALSPSPTKLFMGGGGGGGHANYPNGDASDGAAGGGIVLFKGTAITATGGLFTVHANGNAVVPKLDGDSEGGGGGGGSIYFDVNTIVFGASGFSLFVNGGAGGNSVNGSGDCIGPGGGGGGGYILSRATMPGTVNKMFGGGANGITTSVTNGPCLGSAPANAFGATAGATGAFLDAQASLKTPLGTSVVTCVLAVNLVSFNANVLTDKVMLTWSTASEQNNDYFVIEKSSDGINFTQIATVKGAGNSTQLLSYSYTDETADNGTHYYRIKQIDFDGRYTYSEILSTDIQHGYGIQSLFPQPIDKTEKLNVKYLSSQPSKAFVQIMDALGREASSSSYSLQQGFNLVTLDTEKLTHGIYLLIVSSPDGTQTRKIMVD